MHEPFDWDDTGQARWTDPDTAKQAAISVRPGSARYSLLVAHFRYPAGLTDEQACDLAGLRRVSEYATRCSELTRAGFLEETELTRSGDSGLLRMVRRITPAGRAALIEAT